jgi:hypothetical protein
MVKISLSRKSPEVQWLSQRVENLEKEEKKRNPEFTPPLYPDLPRTKS